MIQYSYGYKKGRTKMTYEEWDAEELQKFLMMTGNKLVKLGFEKFHTSKNQETRKISSRCFRIYNNEKELVVRLAEHFIGSGFSAGGEFKDFRTGGANLDVVIEVENWLDVEATAEELAKEIFRIIKNFESFEDPAEELEKFLGF